MYCNKLFVIEMMEACFKYILCIYYTSVFYHLSHILKKWLKICFKTVVDNRFLHILVQRSFDSHQLYGWKLTQLQSYYYYQ